MRAIFHVHVARDVRGAISHYDSVGGRDLGDAFHEDLMRRIEQMIENPKRFHFYEADIRRANLERFPWHILYRETFFGVRVLVVKHNRRNPRFGLRRK